MDQQVIRETLTYTTRNLTEADKALGAEFNKTAFRALAIANRYLTHGPDAARLAVVKSFLSAISKLAAVDAKAEVEASRQIFLRELHQMTEIVAVDPEVTPTGVVDALTHAPLPTPVHIEPFHQDHQP